ncbi:hypothetical protein CBW65_03850 [Tumebacillus avium]|uniref:Uncharacterized protein n=1 Tax=Tumebacillus avium TaxID=1903704 RepID=A0A1Y0IIG3_9BACL|nr:hypothetical protein CBW65_03850 [Tumebacillus avium]
MQLKGYRKGKGKPPRAAMISQLLQPNNLRHVKFCLNKIGEDEKFEVDYTHLSVEEVMDAIEEQSVYDVPLIVCHMFASEDEIVRIKGLDLWERYQAQSPMQAEEAEPAVETENRETEPEAQEDAGKLRRMEKKLQDLKENREKDRKEWDKQRANLQSENSQLKQELKQAKADLQRVEQERRALTTERDAAKREAAEKKDKIAAQALKIIELENALRQSKEQQGQTINNAAATTPPPEPKRAPIQLDPAPAAPRTDRTPIVIVSDAEWAGRLQSNAYDLAYVTPSDLQRQIGDGLLERAQQVWMLSNDLRMTEQRLVRSLVPKDKLREMRDIIELKKQL